MRSTTPDGPRGRKRQASSSESESDRERIVFNPSDKPSPKRAKKTLDKGKGRALPPPRAIPSPRALRASPCRSPPMRRTNFFSPTPATDSDADDASDTTQRPPLNRLLRYDDRPPSQASQALSPPSGLADLFATNEGVVYASRQADSASEEIRFSDKPEMDDREAVAVRRLLCYLGRSTDDSVPGPSCRHWRQRRCTPSGTCKSRHQQS